MAVARANRPAWRRRPPQSPPSLLEAPADRRFPQNRRTALRAVRRAVRPLRALHPRRVRAVHPLRAAHPRHPLRAVSTSPRRPTAPRRRFQPAAPFIFSAPPTSPRRATSSPRRSSSPRRHQIHAVILAASRRS
eukprot:CAMPEP_0174889184 /NCGR_PEP_ID=MMETSP0167-20121228/4445_1 /TAXON_ID=38298 /ORGANISM="Rhodella maculata, Strain CCMP736" /LENGTH=133 /DNA_ID=CAMNT_0016126487 /DNA_START=86 /DNA_END=484 /DNA_ORIENTATION=-